MILRALLSAVLLIAAAPAPAAWLGRGVKIRTADRLVFRKAGGRLYEVHLKDLDAPARRQEGWKEGRQLLEDFCGQRRARVIWTEIPGEAAVHCYRRDLGAYADASAFMAATGYAWPRPGTHDRYILEMAAIAEARCDGLWGDGSGRCGTGGFGNTTPPGNIISVSYQVTGIAPQAALTYAIPGDGSEQQTVSLPWGTTRRFGADDFLYLSAQNQSETGSVTVSISINGGHPITATSSGAYGIATVSCLLGFSC